MKRYIKSSSDAPDGTILAASEMILSGADQYAAQVAIDLLNSGKEDDIEVAVRCGIDTVNNGNAEPEFEDEDFYLEEADYDTVYNYVKDRFKK